MSFKLPVVPSLLALAGILLVRALRSKPKQPLPPGPKGVPVLGNLLQLPSELLFVKLFEWAKEYGPIYSYTLLGQPLIVLSGAKEAADILDRMSAKTSDRPALIKINEYMCRHREFGFAARNDFWRTHRRAAHETLNVRAAQDFQPMQEDEGRILLEGLLQHPEVDVVKHLHRHSASIAWRAIYGHEAIPLIGHDPSAPMDDFFKQIFVAAVPGGSIVDIFPFLKPMISAVKMLRKQGDDFYEQATEFFIKSHSDAQVEGIPSLSTKLKEMGERIGMGSDEDCGWLGGSLFLAAQDTTATALRWFFVAMLCYPEGVVAARAQLEAVCGDRPPNFSDWDHLPQIEAIMKELLRWRPPAPAGVAHMAAEDLTYGNYVIPKGAILIPNEWSICRDPTLYTNGDAFDPSRFLDEKGHVRTPAADSSGDIIAFGHGRRICIGKSLAINTMWITIAMLLWAYDYKRVKDGQGKEIVPDPMAFWDNGATVWPKPFGYELVPRFPDLAERLKAIHSD